MANVIQKITAEMPEGQQRIESGPLQINNDWPGTFIRGDNAGYYAMSLSMLLKRAKEAKILGGFEEGSIQCLINDLSGCIQGPSKGILDNVVQSVS